MKITVALAAFAVLGCGAALAADQPTTTTATPSGASATPVKPMSLKACNKQADAKNLKLQLGFSHDVEVPIPAGIQIKALKPTEIEITGSDRQKVGQLAAEIRSLRPPEPYKGKGIKYSTETVRRKEGKKK